MLANFAWLLFAHLIADYPLQGEFLANFKGKNMIVLFTHAAIWTGCIVLALKLLGFHFGVSIVISLFLVHTVADVLKTKKLLWYKNLDSLTWGLLIDQSIHIAQIVVTLALV